MPSIILGGERGRLRATGARPRTEAHEGAEGRRPWPSIRRSTPDRAGDDNAHARIVEPSTGDRVEPPLPPSHGIRMTHRLLLSLLLAGASLSACAQSTLPPGSQAQSGKTATDQPRVDAAAAPALTIAAGTPAARALQARKGGNSDIV